MNVKQYGYGPWEYRYVCRSCGHAVRAPKNSAPCSICGGDFAQERISMRKVFLEPEPAPIIEKEEYVLEKTFFDRIKGFFGVKVPTRYGIREIKRRPPRKWRWQTHAEVEEVSGIMRHEDFM
ncbi:MAG: hypothetical protein Q4G68_10815 [Planctomycetia bacterium]|nr:hypothetical protein [Planctomycetia bacterium]